MELILNALKAILVLILGVIASCIVYVLITAVRIAVMEIRYERESKYKE